MSAITIRGTSIVSGFKTAQSARYREWVVGDTASTTTAAEYIEVWSISRDNVFAIRPAAGASATTPYTACKFREFQSTPDGFDATVQLIYRSAEAAQSDAGGGGDGLAVGSTLKQLDVGVVAQPLPLHPYFSVTAPTITSMELYLVNELLTNANSVTDNGTTLTFTRNTPNETTATTSTALTGKARELAIYRLHGVESYYIPAPIFRLTRGFTNADFTSFGAVGRRDYPAIACREPQPTGSRAPTAPMMPAPSKAPPKNGRTTRTVGTRCSTVSIHNFSCQVTATKSVVASGSAPRSSTNLSMMRAAVRSCPRTPARSSEHLVVSISAQ